MIQDIASFPADGEPQSYWQYEGAKQKLEKEPGNAVPRLPANCDVVIVGGGYAGVATAYHLLNSTFPPREVILLEANDACSGATGRNGGHLRPDYFMAAASTAKRYTAAAAAEVVQFEADNFSEIKSLIRSEGIECDFCETTSLTVFTTSEQAAAARDKYELLGRECSFKNAILHNVEIYTGDDSPQRTGVIQAKGYCTTPAAHLSPYKFVMALLLRCIELGHRVNTNTTVLSVEKFSADSHILKTGAGETVTARKVIIATNAYTSALLPEYNPAIMPCKGQVCRIAAPEGKKLPRLLFSSYAIMEQDAKSNTTGYDYLVQLADNSIVVGGAHHKYDKNDPDSWYKNVDNTQSIQPARRYFEEDYMQRTFIGWEDSQACVRRDWTGIMGYTDDSLPHVGKVSNREGVFVIAGFNGHGMPVGFLAAKGVAAMAAQGTNYEQTGLPSLYKTTWDRLISKKNDILAGRGMRLTTQ